MAVHREADDVREIDLTLNAHGNACRVRVNGQDVRAYKVEIVAEYHEATRVTLYCYGPGYKPYTLRGRMVVEEDTSQSEEQSDAS